MMNQNTITHNQPADKYLESFPVKVKKLTVVLTAFGILLYLADIISDICLAVRYYNTGHPTFFILTLFLVILSAVVSSLLSFYMYWMDDNKKSKAVWIIRALFLIFGIAPVLRNFNALWHAWKYYRCKVKADKVIHAQNMRFEIKDGSYLKLYEAFLESGPQLILQMYIFAGTQSVKPSKFTETETSQCITMLISALSISSTIVGYSKSFQNTVCHENKSKLLPQVFQFLYRFFEVKSRIIAMSLGISVTPFFHIVFAIHYVVAAIFLYFKLKGPNYKQHWYELHRVPLLSVIMIFVYFIPELGKQDCFTSDAGQHKTRFFFYLIMFIENTATMVFWIFFSSPERSLMFMATVIQGSSFCLCIVFMVIYYKCFHHSSKRPSPRNCLNDIVENTTENKDAEEVKVAAFEELVQVNDERMLELRDFERSFVTC